MIDPSCRSRENESKRERMEKKKRETTGHEGREGRESRVVGKDGAWYGGWRRVDTFEEGSVDAVAEPVSGCYGTKPRARASSASQ